MDLGEPHLNTGRRDQLQYRDQDHSQKWMGHIDSWKSCNGPFAVRNWQPLDPPPQLRMPESPMSDAPIMTITVPERDKEASYFVCTYQSAHHPPVTIGGKIRCRARGGMNDRPILRNEHTYQGRGCVQLNETENSSCSKELTENHTVRVVHA